MTGTRDAPPHLEQAVGLVRSLVGVDWDEDRNSSKKVHEDDGGISHVVWESRTEVLARCGSFQALVLAAGDHGHRHVRGDRGAAAGGAYAEDADALRRRVSGRARLVRHTNGRAGRPPGCG